MFSGVLMKNLKKHDKRHGQASIELVMSILFFVMMLGTLLSMSMYMYINHTFLTGAKEGARKAAVESRLANSNTRSQGEATVKAYVRDLVSSSSGIQLANSNITLTGPVGTVGDRNVTVTITYDFQNPVQVRTFIDRLSGGSQTGLDTFRISNRATMRYEE
jgi:uncharacterized protein (UPF0333 family)